LGGEGFAGGGSARLFSKRVAVLSDIETAGFSNRCGSGFAVFDGSWLLVGLGVDVLGFLVFGLFFDGFGHVEYEGGEVLEFEFVVFEFHLRERVPLVDGLFVLIEVTKRNKVTEILVLGSFLLHNGSKYIFLEQLMGMHGLIERVHVVVFGHDTREVPETFGQFLEGLGVVASRVVRRELNLVHEGIGLGQELPH
jgi:hypothetical protein